MVKYGERRQLDEVELPGSLYCDLVSRLEDRCAQHSLLEMWRYREELINSTTGQEIRAGVNLLKSSPWFSHSANFTSLLGGLTRNSSGHVVAATTALMFWQISVPDNVTVIESQGSGVELELGDATSTTCS